MISTSSIPARAASSTTSWIAGTSITGSMTFGCALVAGRNRVPSPAAGMTALRTLMAAPSSRPLVPEEGERYAHRATTQIVGPPYAVRPTGEASVHLPGHAHVRVHLPRLRPHVRHRPEDDRRAAHGVPGVRRCAPEGVRGPRDRVQGVRVLRHGPREEGEAALRDLGEGGQEGHQEGELHHGRRGCQGHGCEDGTEGNVRAQGKRRLVTTAEIGVFGGSGFYAFLEDPEEVAVDTAYGKPAAPVTVGTI